MKQRNRLWKSKVFAVAEWLYFTFLVNDHHILHSFTRNVISGDSFLYIFLKFTFPSSVSCFWPLYCTFPSLLKLPVQRVRTFLMPGHWYANQSDNRQMNLPLWFILLGGLQFKAGITASVYMYIANGKLSLKYRGIKITLKNKKKNPQKLKAEILHALGAICQPPK